MRNLRRRSGLNYGTLENRNLLTTLIVDTAADSDGSILDGRISLREAIVAANTDAAFGDAPAGNGPDEIQFSSHLAGKTFRLQHGELLISDRLSIGGDITIDARTNSRVFKVETPRLVHLDGLTITNGIARDDGNGLRGGGILSQDESNIRLTGVAFENNVGQWGGGAIFTHQGHLVVENSTFTENANAIYKVDGRLVVKDSTFVGNESWGASAIYHEQGTRDISGSEFRSNESTAVRALGGFTSISSSTFIENRSTQFGTQFGGAILQTEGTIAVSGSSFVGNMARNRGSGIYADNAKLFVSNSDFEGNDRRAIALVNSAEGFIADSTFTDNTRTAVYALQGSTLRIARSEFYGNEDVVQVAAGGTATINQSTFGSMDQPNFGVVIQNTSSDLNLFNSTFVGNQGQALSHLAGVVKIRNSEFVDNISDDGGSLIYNVSTFDNSEMQIRNSRFHGNTNVADKGVGGAIRSNGGDVSLFNVTFTANQSRLGGAIAVVGGELNINRVFFGDKNDPTLGNLAGAFTENNHEIHRYDFSGVRFDGEGGAIFVGISANVRIANSRFFDNVAHSEGGAIAIEQVDYYEGAIPSVTVTANTVFARNRVFADLFASPEKGHQRGGTIFNRGGELLVRDSFFFENESEGDGGGLFNAGGTAVLRTLVFNENKSDVIGGAIFNHGELRLLQSRVANNIATIEGGLAESAVAMTFVSDTTFVGNTE